MADCLFTVLYFFSAGAVAHILGHILPSCFLCSYGCTARTLLTLVIAYYALPFFKKKYFDARILPRNKAVLITGCDSGFGHQLAKRLDLKGFHVFAGCLFPSGDGAKTLKETSSDRLHVLGLDVTKDKSVQEALKYVKENLQNAELWAVVNNAGIFQGLEVACSAIKHFEFTMDVNALGVVRVTKTFLPLLFKSKGRVVTVTSIAGRLSFPGYAAYCMSKFASTAFCECLRQEVRPWGVKVIAIEPEGFKTNINNLDIILKDFEKVVADVDEDIKEEYGDAYFDGIKSHIVRCSNMCSPRTDKVVDSLEDAVSLLEPSSIYRPRRNVFATIIVALWELLPSPLVDIIIRTIIYSKGYPVPKGAVEAL